MTLYDIISHIIDVFWGKSKSFGTQIADILRFHGSEMEFGAFYPLAGDSAPESLHQGNNPASASRFFWVSF
ncbi:MAG: hypothetical protein AAGU04_00930 [Anaerolineaceae bacterium]